MAKILVVDDEPDIVRVVVKMMEAGGHRVRTAGDGFEAIEECAQDRPDIIILDLHLPHIDGFELCRRLRSGAATRDIPIVMMTAAYLSVADADKSERAGADRYVVKPFIREILVRNVEQLIAAGPAASPTGGA